MKTILAAAALALAVMSPAFAQQATTTAPATTAPAATTPAKPATTAPTAATPAKPATVAAPSTAPTKPASAPAKVVKLVNVNTATEKELDALPKIGKARASAIVKNRPYASVEELSTKAKLPKDAYEAIKDKVTVK